MQVQVQQQVQPQQIQNGGFVSVRNEMEAKDKKALRCSVPICSKKSKKIIKRKIMKEEMQLINI